MKPTRRWPLRPLMGLLLVSIVGMAASLCAAQDGEANPIEAPIGTLFRWLNFLLVFGGLAYLIAKYGPAFFRRRAEFVSASIQQAAAAKAEAEKHLRAAESKLQGLDREAVELRAAARRESAAEAERIRAATRDDAEKIARAARAEIEAAERAARLELKALAARAAVDGADALLRRQITAATRAALFQSFLSKLERSAS